MRPWGCRIPKETVEAVLREASSRGVVTSREIADWLLTTGQAHTKVKYRLKASIVGVLKRNGFEKQIVGEGMYRRTVWRNKGG